jgi:hypothetical protein
MHLLRISDGQFQPPSEGRPALVEVLAQCDSTVDLSGLDETARRDGSLGALSARNAGGAFLRQLTPG